jgi:hypothetical protein
VRRQKGGTREGGKSSRLGWKTLVERHTEEEGDASDDGPRALGARDA